MIFYGNFQGLEFNSVQIEDFRYAKKTRQIIFYDGNYGSSVPFKFDTFSQLLSSNERSFVFQVMFLGITPMIKAIWHHGVWVGLGRGRVRVRGFRSGAYWGIWQEQAEGSL